MEKSRKTLLDLTRSMCRRSVTRTKAAYPWEQSAVFAGVINAEGAKGVFVTTSYFLKKAKEFVAKSPQRIVLIDGRELARLLVVHGVGVRQKACYVIHEIDVHYFDPDD